MTMSGQRLRWMDFIRGICILLVIFVHASSVLADNGVTYPRAFNIFNEFLDPFRMPLLMFLSGMLLPRSLAKSERDYLWGKFCLIFWPFLLWSMATYAADNRLTWEYVLKTPISAPSVMWYLWFLFAYYVIVLFLVRLSIPITPIIILSLIASEFLPPFVRMDRFAALFVFFLLGYCVAQWKFSMKGRAAIAFFGLFAAVSGGIFSVAFGKIKYDPLFVWVPLGLILFVLWSTSFYTTSKFSAAIEWIGRNSIVFYAVHFPALLISARLMVNTTILEGGSFYIILFLWVVAVGAFMQILRRRSSIITALFDFRKILKSFNVGYMGSARKESAAVSRFER